MDTSTDSATLSGNSSTTQDDVLLTPHLATDDALAAAGSDPDTSINSSKHHTPAGSNTPTDTVEAPGRNQSGTIIARPIWAQPPLPHAGHIVCVIVRARHHLYLPPTRLRVLLPSPSSLSPRIWTAAKMCRPCFNSYISASTKTRTGHSTSHEPVSHPSNCHAKATSYAAATGAATDSSDCGTVMWERRNYNDGDS